MANLMETLAQRVRQRIENEYNVQFERPEDRNNQQTLLQPQQPQEQTPVQPIQNNAVLNDVNQPQPIEPPKSALEQATEKKNTASTTADTARNTYEGLIAQRDRGEYVAPGAIEYAQYQMQQAETAAYDAKKEWDEIRKSLQLTDEEEEVAKSRVQEITAKAFNDEATAEELEEARELTNKLNSDSDTGWERAKDVVGSAATGVVGSTLEAASNINDIINALKVPDENSSQEYKDAYENAQQIRAQYERLLQIQDTGRDPLDQFGVLGEQKVNPVDLQMLQVQLEAATNKANEIALKDAGAMDTALRRGADYFSEKSENMYDKAVQNATGFEKLLADVGKSGSEMIADLLLGGGAFGSMGVMATRSYGSGAREARKSGADAFTAGLTGLASMAKEIATEKMFDGLAGIYGKGAADDVVEHFISSFATSKAERNVLNIGYSILGEAMEEGIGGLADPFINNIYEDGAIKEAYGTAEGRKKLAKDIGNAMLCASVLGGFGGVTSVGKSTFAEWRETKQAQDLAEKVSEEGTSKEEFFDTAEEILNRQAEINEENMSKADIDNLIRDNEALQNFMDSHGIEGKIPPTNSARRAMVKDALNGINMEYEGKDSKTDTNAGTVVEDETETTANESENNAPAEENEATNKNAQPEEEKTNAENSDELNTEENEKESEESEDTAKQEEAEPKGTSEETTNETSNEQTAEEDTEKGTESGKSETYDEPLTKAEQDVSDTLTLAEELTDEEITEKLQKKSWRNAFEKRTGIKLEGSNTEQIETVRSYAEDFLNDGGFPTAEAADAIGKDTPFNRYKEKVAVKKEKARVSRETAAINEIVRDLNSKTLHPEKGKTNGHIPQPFMEVASKILEYFNSEKGTSQAEKVTQLKAELEQLMTARPEGMSDADYAKAVSKLQSQVDSAENKIGKVGDLSKAYQAIQTDKDYQGFYDPVIQSAFDSFIDTIKGKRLSELTGKELKQLREALTKFQKATKETNTARIDDERQEVSRVAAQATVEVRDSYGAAEMGNMEEANTLRKIFASVKETGIRGFLNLANADTVFNLLSNYKDSIIAKLGNTLKKAEVERAEVNKKISEFFTELTDSKEARRELRKKMWQKIDTTQIVDSEGNNIFHYEKSGNPVTKMTLGQLASVYANLRSKNTANHLLRGGLTKFESYNGRNGARNGNSKVQIAGLGSDIIQSFKNGEITDAECKQKLEERRTKLLDSIKEILESEADGYAMKWIDASDKALSFIRNKIDKMYLERYGFKPQMVDDYYFPTVIDENFRGMSAEDFSKSQSESDWGRMKQQSGVATQPLLLLNIDDIISSYCNQASGFLTTTQAVADFRKVWGTVAYGGLSTDADGYAKFGGGTKTSLRDQVANKWGNGGTQYIEKLLKDLSGHSNSYATPLDKIRGNYAQGVLSANISVTLSQFTSYLAAGGMLDMKSLTQGWFNNEHIADIYDKIYKYSPLMYDRVKGGNGVMASQANTAARMAENAPLVFGLIGWADQITTSKLWMASEAYVKSHAKEILGDIAKDKGMSVSEVIGTEDFYKAVAEKWTEVMQKSQPMYTVMQRSGLARSDSDVVRSFAMFKTVGFQYGNLVFNGYAEAAIREKELKSAKKNGTASEIATAREAHTKAVKKAWKTYGYVMASEVAFAAVKTIAKGILHKGDDWRDDETGEFSFAELGKDFGWTAASACASIIPFGNALVAGVEYAFEKANGNNPSIYDTYSLPAISAINDVINKSKKLVGALFEEKNPDKVGHIVSAAYDATKDLLMTAFGLPMNNAEQIAEATVNWYLDIKSTIDGGHEFGDANFDVVDFIKARFGEDGEYDPFYKYSNKQLANQMINAFMDGDDEKLDALRTEINNTAETEVGQDTAETMIRTQLNSMYSKDEIGKEDLFDALTELCGMTDDEADQKIAEWDFKKEYGVPYSDMKEYYLKKGEFPNGTPITVSQIIEWEMTINGRTRGEAIDIAGWYQFQKEFPSIKDLTLNDYKAWSKGEIDLSQIALITNIRETASLAGADSSVDDLDEKDYPAIDALLSNVYPNLDEASVEYLDNSFARLDDMYSASKVGIDSETYYKYLYNYKLFAAGDGTADEKLINWKTYVDSQPDNLKPAQRTWLKNNFKFTSTMVAEAKSYDKMLNIGMQPEVIDYVSDGIKTIKPRPGHTEASPLQICRWATDDKKLTYEEKYQTVLAHGSESQKKVFKIAYENEYDYKEITTFLEVLDSLGSSVSQKNLFAALNYISDESIREEIWESYRISNTGKENWKKTYSQYK